MLEACRVAGLALNVGTLRRYHPGYRAARRLVEQGELGDPGRAVACTPGILLPTHSHSLDTLLHLLGDPAVGEVVGRLAAPVSAGPRSRLPRDPEVLWAQITCRGGARAALLSAPGRPRV